ncbi:MAG: hypothetical protein HYS12_20895 [Planctomycetes bacterium]|nr:hypothetical protein [Planctomycetota bacterium]
MSLKPQQRLELLDGHRRTLGRVEIERVQGDLVFGRFTPAEDFVAVEGLFADYIEAANDQLLSAVADLDQTIASLGLSFRAEDGSDLVGIADVQIGEGTINFRLPSREEQASTRQGPWLSKVCEATELVDEITGKNSASQQD